MNRTTATATSSGSGDRPGGAATPFIGLEEMA